MWCSASTRRDIRETSMRCMNESSRSGSRYGEDRERPSERLGMTALLGCRHQKPAGSEETVAYCSSRRPRTNLQNASFCSSVLISGYLRNLYTPFVPLTYFESRRMRTHLSKADQ